MTSVVVSDIWMDDNGELCARNKCYSLKDTVKLMLSDDYKDRMKAETLQVMIRKKALEEILEKHDKGKLEFKLTTPVQTLRKQLVFMDEYEGVMRRRCSQEGVLLTGEE